MIAIGLVACAKTKRPGPLPAAEKYSSPLFIKSLAAARAQCAEAFVLSAKHGLLPLDTIVDDYDQSLAETPKHLRIVWEANVARALAERFGGQVIELRVWAGRDYVTCVRGATRGQKWTVVEPLKGMQIGERLQALAAEAPSSPLSVLADLVAAIDSVEVFDDDGRVEKAVRRASALLGIGSAA